jgi:hypothetical protein
LYRERATPSLAHLEAILLNPFGDEIWVAVGPTLSVAGFDYPTRMVVIRLCDGTLFVWSPTVLAHELKIAVDQLGPVRHIVAPNSLHHRFIECWHHSYPEATIHAVPELRARQSQLAWGSDLDDGPNTAWSTDIDQVIMRGNWITTEAVFFHRRSRTAIFTDLIQHFERGSFSGWRGVIAKFDLLTSPRPTVPRKFRIAFRDRTSARDALRRIMAWPTEAVLMAHGTPVRHDGRDAIARAFSWLLRQ